MNLDLFVVTFHHMPHNVRSILSMFFILSSLILIIDNMAFSIAKPLITIFAFALNNIFYIIYATIYTGMTRQILKIKWRQLRLFLIYSRSL